MGYVFWWLIAAVPCFLLAYINGADLNFRLKSVNYDDGFWKSSKNFFSEGFRLLIHDYFGVFCPWSWEVAKRHRLADMRTYLGADGKHHDTLGFITATDCDNAEKQEAIARQAYISRTKHWAHGVFLFLIAPIQGVFMIVSGGIMGIVELGRYLKGKNT
ncbi:MAG: hypothetical protein G01um101456_653 [Parcubacteria group bacterium Gr01-1014_56]|nr:MAG: hypothetical protein G01um101456_653 [Parcubacteria group bacterium Gr01-1014_56]